MNPTDFAWSTVEFITRKSPKEIKVIVDDAKYPSLSKDSEGCVIHLSSPRIVDENLLSIHGLHFDNDLNGKIALWRMFRASLFHLSLHALATDYEIYKEFLSHRNYQSAMFAVSLAEDYAVRGLMRSEWPGLIVDTAYANYLSASRLRGYSRQTDLATRIAANLISYSITGRSNISLGGGIDEAIRSARSSLAHYSQKLYEMYHAKSKSEIELGSSSVLSDQINSLKLGAAENVAKLFDDEHYRLKGVPALPYAEHYEKGDESLFGDANVTINEDERTRSLTDCLEELQVSPSAKELKENEKRIQSEATQLLEAWEYSLILKKRLIEVHRKIDKDTHFEFFGIPEGDFGEFVRVKTRLVGKIRRALDLLRIAHTAVDELNGMEQGFLDLSLAIQVIASKSNRNDVFVREEPNKKSETWAILIDCSKSLEKVAGTVRDATVCMAEIVNGMLPSSNSWACYTFNENFYIVKDYSERYSNDIRARIGGIKSGLKTYLPDAIRLASLRLQESQSDLKALVVVSDGYPMGYEGIDKELIRAVEKVNRSGVTLIGLGVESAAISKYFKLNCVARDAYEMMKHLVNIYYELATI